MLHSCGSKVSPVSLNTLKTQAPQDLKPYLDPNYPLIYPKYPLLRFIRAPLKGPWGVPGTPNLESSNNLDAQNSLRILTFNLH